MDGLQKSGTAREAWAQTVWDALSKTRLRGVLALIGLCLAVYLPGVLMLPAVDRTEVVYAETARDMVARGAWADPRYGETIHQFRPVGTYWAQGVAAALATQAHARDIWVYRLPGLLAATLSVAALFVLTAPVAGNAAALMAAVLFAAAPLTAALAQLAITEGLSLLAATVAMLALLRIYRADDHEPTARLASAFWIATGTGMLLNALQVPILVAVTLLALFAFDRDLSWFKRTHAAWGVPLMVALASPWIAVRAYQDGGVPFAGMNWPRVLDALAGSQDMKLKAWPGTFVLAAVLGFLPGTAFLIPAIRSLWRRRDTRLARFLLAWAGGYLVYLELLSSKPGTYSVQVMFPALALAVAMLVTRGADSEGGEATTSFVPPPPFGALFALVILAAPYLFATVWPGPLAVAMIAAVAALFAWSAREGRSGALHSWALTGAAGTGLLAITLLAVILPAIDILWPARQIERALAACPQTPRAILGFPEPSSYFRLKSDRMLSAPEAIADKGPPVAVVEQRWMDRYAQALAAKGQTAPPPDGCVEAYNTMRGCALKFAIHVAPRAGCSVPPQFACNADSLIPARDLRATGDCD